MKKIAILVQNIIQWYSVSPLVRYIDEQKEFGYEIIIYDPKDNPDGWHAIANSLEKAIIKDGFRATRKAKNRYYAALAPYSNMITFLCKYRFGYCYGAATTKPALTLQPEFKEGFHAIFLHDTYGAELFSVYSKVYIVPDLYLTPVHHKKVSKKPVVVFLPTYHEPSTIKVANSLKKLKNKYYIITKSHHGTDYLEDEAEKKIILDSVADEVYDSNEYIMTLFEKADVVLSDNSGAAMDAFYSGIPVAITAENINQGISGINTLQHTLVEKGIFTYTDEPTPQNLDKIITEALTKKEIQAAESAKLFPEKHGGAKVWYEIIRAYVNGEKEANYCKMHDYLVEKRCAVIRERDDLVNKLNKLYMDNETLCAELERAKYDLGIYQNSRIHRAIEKLLAKRRKQQKKRTN